MHVELFKSCCPCEEPDSEYLYSLSIRLKFTAQDIALQISEPTTDLLSVIAFTIDMEELNFTEIFY